MACPVARLLDGAEHDRDVRAQADAVGTRCTSSQRSVSILSGTAPPGLVVEDLGAGARQCTQSGVFQPDQVRVERLAEPSRPLVDL